MATNDEPSSHKTEDEELEEGELKDDDDDDEDDDNDDVYDKREVCDPPQMNNHTPMVPSHPPGTTYPRGELVSNGPMQKSNARCRFYSRTSNKCTWGDRCRFEHRDDSPEHGDTIDNGIAPGQHNSMPPRPQMGVPMPPMAPAERPYPPYGRIQPYPIAMPNYNHYDPYTIGPSGYSPYDPYGPPPPPPHHQSPPLPPLHQPTSSSGGAAIAGYHNPQSSVPSALYERKQRLAFELAPWNDRNSAHPSTAYSNSGPRFHRTHYSRDPYQRNYPPPPGYYMNDGGPPYSSYPTHPSYPPNHPSSHRHLRAPYSSQRSMPPTGMRPRSNKRAHDEGESSWSDSGSDDSILAQASYSNKNHTHKSSKRLNHRHMPAQPPSPHHDPNQRTQEAPAHLDDNDSTDNTLDHVRSTPPSEPISVDKERQEMLLNKLREIEDLMAKKKGEHEDPAQEV